jgi:hypothetical protein
MSIIGPGTAMSSLASLLHWRVRGETNHQQVEVRIGESVISVDRGMAEVVLLLDKAEIVTATSCIGTAETWGYVMFIGADSAERFLRIWQRYLVPLRHPMPELDFTARDEEWWADIAAYPLPRAAPVDEEGLTFTARWREHRDDMIEILPKLEWALRRHLRESAEE